MIQNGNLIRLNLNGSLIAKMTALDMNVEREMLDKTDKFSNNWTASQPGNKSFSLSCEGFVVDPYDKNILMYSENFANTYWTKTGATISATLYADPNGFIRANRTSGFSTSDSIAATIADTLPTGDYVFSVWIKTVTGEVDVDLELKDDTSGDTVTITATTTWTRYSVTHDLTTGSGVEVSIIAGGTAEIQVFGAQLESGTVATEYEPTGVKYSTLFAAVENGTKFNVQISDATTGNQEYVGEAYVSNLSLTAPQGQLVTFSCELTGEGDLTMQTI
jgi:hypothetical protein